jgi:hypothetical protein
MQKRVGNPRPAVAMALPPACNWMPTALAIRVKASARTGGARCVSAL